MLSREINDISLGQEAYQRLSDFYRRFCEGELGAHYGLGHLLYACHAAFPLLLSPEMANLILVNFKDYSFWDGRRGKVDPVAAADILFSPLCRQTGHNRFEMYSEIRTYLLQLLKDGSWFSLFGIRTGGEARLRELAGFVLLYSTGKTDTGTDASRIRQLNEWASLAWLNPGLLATKISRVLEDNDSVNNRNGQLWLHNQMDRLNHQFHSNIVEPGSKSKSLLPFYNLYHYSKAKKDELLNRSADTVYDSARQIENESMDDGKNLLRSGSQKLIRLKLSRNMAERTNRKLNEIQRVLVLAITEESSPASTSFLTNGLAAMESHGGVQFKTWIFSDEDLNFEMMLPATVALEQQANPEDLILIYITRRLPGSFGISNFFEILEARWPAIKNMQVVFISGYEYISESQLPPRVISLGLEPLPGAGNRIMNGATSGAVSGAAFVYEMGRAIIFSPGVSYRDLLLWLRFRLNLLEGTEDERAALLAPSGLSDNRFLSGKKNPRGDKHLLSFNPLVQRWQVVPEAFQLLPLSTNATVYDYDSRQPVGDSIGELVSGNQPGLNYYAGNDSAMDKEKFYLVYVERQPFRAKLYCSADDADEEAQRLKQALRAALNTTDTQGFLYWDGQRTSISMRPGEDIDSHALSPGEFAIGVRHNSGREYLVIYNEEKSFVETNNIRSWHGMDERSLQRLFPLLSRYYYLKYLDQPAGPLRSSLNFAVGVNWKRPDEDTIRKIDRSLVLDEKAIYFRDGKVGIYPLAVQVSNHEEIPLYYAVYLLCSDLSIWKIGNKGRLDSGQSEKQQMDEPDLLLRIVGKDIDASIKLLVSRDPIDVEFSQPGFY